MGSHHWGRDEERQALDAYVKLMRAAESVTALLLPRLAAAGLTMGQFGVLEALHHVGPLAQHELAGKLLRSSGNVSVVIDNLEKAGLVQRKRRPVDRRVVVVSLTPAGARADRRAVPPSRGRPRRGHERSEALRSERAGQALSHPGPGREGTSGSG